MTSLRGGDSLCVRQMIKVRIVETSRDGHVLKWTDASGTSRQCKCQGKTQRARESFRKKKESEVNDRARELSWSEYWSRLTDVHFPGLSETHRKKCLTMHTRLAEAAERMGFTDLRCSDITPAMLLDVEAAMRRSDVEEATIRSAMAALWSIISWGQDYGLIADFRRPRKRRGKAAKKTTKSKGRSLAMEEIERMESKIPDCLNKTELPDGFLRAMKAMYLIGMRKSEAWQFRWDPEPGAHWPVRLKSADAAIVFSDSQKSGLETEVPLTDEAIQWLRELEKARAPKSSPWICRTSGRYGEHATHTRLGRVISDAGTAAGIVVKRWTKTTGEKIKCASSHDLRRTFATNLQRDLTISERQRLTRHSDAKTLLEHYLDAPTPVLVAKLRGG